VDSAGGREDHLPHNAEDSHSWDDVPNEGQVVELGESRAGGESGNRGERLFLEDNEVRDVVYILRMEIKNFDHHRTQECLNPIRQLEK